ncbi:ricin-type beta-trefoil lectin domain protein [Kitasatospora sp. NPDC049258]|uniref:ricin-type beta-trefoil lectin domain protein n=1 Tax=Kitasatospora sp. NPDC049258 TaxID=3155394 RepID=UPI00343114D0
MAPLVTVLAGVLIAAPGAGATGRLPGPATADAPVGGHAPELSAQVKAMLAARAEARAAGAPVEVVDLTTESSKTVANPDGTLTVTDHAAPIRVKQKAGWAEVDPTLRANADGTFGPAVASTTLVLSGGGTGPLATLTTAKGERLAVTAPFRLPKPVVAGDTATYPGVLPDVDLRVNALPQGGWREVIVVKTAAAAADPALRTLRFPISTSGLTASADAEGNLAFTDGSGRALMHAPTPLQWDSALPAPVAPGKSSAMSSARSLFASPSGIAPVSPGGSTLAAPGDGANVAPITTTVTPTAIELTPGQDVLGKGTGPWYIDPTISADSGSQLSVQVQENIPGTSGYNLSELHTGYCLYPNCPGAGRYRAYYQIGINPAIYTQGSGMPKPPTVYSSMFYAQSVFASSPGTSVPLGLYSVGSGSGRIYNGTNWGNQPCGTGSTMAGCAKVGGSSRITGTGPISFDVTSQVQSLAAAQAPAWTVGIAPDDERNAAYRHHLANNPHIVTTYDITPSIWSPTTVPNPGFANSDGNGTPGSYACTSGGAHPWDNAPWVGANQSIMLTASSWSPAGFNLHTAFHLWDDNDATYGVAADSGWAGSWNPNGVGVSVGSLVDGHQYGWSAAASDADPASQGLTSADSPWCYFRVDKTAPAVAVSSTDFPPSGAPGKAGKSAGEAGTFRLSGFDAAPAVGGASGLACYRVSTDPTPVAGWKCNDGKAKGVVLPADPTFQATPGHWGTNIVYAQAQDNAGNYSQPAAYAFYAPWNPQAKAVYGDTTGDGRPDIVLPDRFGNLKLISAAADPLNALSANASLARNVTSSNTPGWDRVQITHRGALTALADVDYLIAHGPGDPAVYEYANNGSGVFTAATSIGAVPHDCRDASGAALPGGCPAGFTDTNFTWTKVTQIVAVGTPEGEDTAHGVTRTSLVAVVDRKLWLFHSGGKDNLDGTARLLSSADWSNYDLMNPGPAGGTQQPSLWARNQADGTVHTYPITGGATPDYSGLADPAAGTVSGINLPYATYPMVGSSGDLDGDSLADLWASNGSGTLTVWNGVNGTTPASNKVTGLVSRSAATIVTEPVGRWKLDGSQQAGGPKTADAVGRDATVPLGTNPGSLTDVTFVDDNPAGTAVTPVATFAGASSEVDVPGVTVDTGKSFTVSAWLRPSASQGVALSSDGVNSSGFIVWPDADGTWHFGMATTDNPQWNYDQTLIGVTSAARYKFDRWDQVTASYNADAGVMSLYVNGTLAATGIHTQNSGIKGPLVFGRYQDNHVHQAFFKGAVSDVTVQDRALDPWSAAAHPISLATIGTMCMDDNYASTTNGAVIQIAGCNSTPAQDWTVAPDGTLRVKGGCLDAVGGGTANGTRLQYWACGAHQPSQKFVPLGNGTIYNPVSGRCVDLPNYDATPGNPLALFDCNGTSAQRWSVTPRG